jgi:hypothetical protein
MVRSCGLDASGSGQGLVTDTCEHGNEPSGSKKGGKFLELSYCYLLKKDSAA